MEKVLKAMYNNGRGKITAADVWAYADSGKITEDAATRICGPRPKSR